MKEYLRGTETTHMFNGGVTDSAASGTALSSGYKTKNGYIGVTPELKPRATILEAAQLAGKKAGMVSTYHWSHATPAAYAAHNISRENVSTLSEQVVNQGLDVVLGTAFGSAEWGSLKEVTDRGYTVVKTKAELAAVAQGAKIWGNCNTSNSPLDIKLFAQQATLAEMTDAAIRALSNDENGFFLMVEGSSVDGGGHANDIKHVVSEYLAFDAAFNVAVEYAKTRTDTIVIAMPDHDTGGLNLPVNLSWNDEIGGNPDYNDYLAAIQEVQMGENSTNGITWTNKNHTGRRCGVWMYLPDGINPPEGLATVPGDTLENRGLIIDNTDIAPYIADLIGVDLDEATEQLFLDVTSMGDYDTDSGIFIFTNTNVSIKANTSVASIGDQDLDLNGEIAVYSGNKFYVPSKLTEELRGNLDPYIKTARYRDDTTGRVLIKGKLDKPSTQDNLTLLLVKKNTETIEKDDIGYIAQTKLNSDGSYVVKFTFNGNVDDYELIMRLGNEVVNDSIISATASYSWLDSIVRIYLDDDNKISSDAVINSYYDMEGLTYIMSLIFYDENNKLLGVSMGDITEIVEDKIMDSTLPREIPEGTKSVKAIVWADFTQMIPLCNNFARNLQ
jgi:alkaline phosphatase